MSASHLEFRMLVLLRASGLPEPEKELAFAAGRRWRFDLAYPQFGIAIELEGGTYVGGRHTRPSGFAEDCEKYNAAAALGWRVFRYTGNMINGLAADQIKKAMETIPNELPTLPIQKPKRKRKQESE